MLGFDKSHRKEQSMIKGTKKKAELQNALKILAIQKGYANVTMKDIGNYVGLSVGGLYHHYHNVNEIFNDLLISETENVWAVFKDIQNFDDLMKCFDTYLKAEEKELLNEECSVNNLLYQYYFSFPEKERSLMMKQSHDEAISHMIQILKPIYKNKKIYTQIAEHVYIILHGLVDMSFSEALTQKIIREEFSNLKNYMKEMYQTVNNTNKK